MKALKSDKCKQAVRDGTLDSKTLSIVPRIVYRVEDISEESLTELLLRMYEQLMVYGSGEVELVSKKNS